MIIQLVIKEEIKMVKLTYTEENVVSVSKLYILQVLCIF